MWLTAPLSVGGVCLYIACMVLYLSSVARSHVKVHITLDDLPWQWADYGGSNTVILVGLPRGEHKVRIEAVDAEGGPFIARTVTFTVPGPASSSR